MSAIAGIFHLNEEPVSIDDGKNVMMALRQYPADDIQTWYKKNIFLGCHAQWITPESVGERLPYYDAKRSLAITADAIIDNRNELFERLQVDQSSRKRMPDSELILLAYQKWGEDTPEYLMGDFAFMIWDGTRRIFFGARDFSGNRTLYFFKKLHRFAFCTTIQPLFSLPYVKKALNEQWLAEFLAIPGMLDAVDVTSTVFRNIEQVPPAHTILVSRDRVVLSRYCTIVPGEQLKLKSNQEYVEAFREVFESAVTARLRTRHNVGVRLSGGLDSGSVASFAARALSREKKQLNTFSYVPPNDFVDWTPKGRIADERPFIKAIVDYVGNIRDHYLDFEGTSPLSEIDDLIGTMEMPYKFFSNSFWLKGTYEKAKQQNVGILLNGGRGNYTISWGSAIPYYIHLLKKLKWFSLYHEINLYSRNLGIKKKRVFMILGKKAFPFIFRKFPSEEWYSYPLLINPEFAKRTSVVERLREHGIDVRGTPTSIPNIYEARKQRFEQLSYWNVPGTSASKMSLRYSIWERDPTNDLRVIKFCLSVPEEQYVQNGLDRALIRRATEGYLPDQVRLNQRIRGVQGADAVHRMIPSWSGFIKELQQICADEQFSEFFNLEAIEAAILKLRDNPSPEYVIDPDFKILTRSLIVYRFLKTLQ